MPVYKGKVSEIFGSFVRIVPDEAPGTVTPQVYTDGRTLKTGQTVAYVLFADNTGIVLGVVA